MWLAERGKVLAGGVSQGLAGVGSARAWPPKTLKANLGSKDRGEL